MKNLYACSSILSLLIACRSSGYQSFGVDVTKVQDVSKGVLIESGTKKKYSLSMCLPREGVPFPCILSTKEEWFKARADLKHLQERLKTCESR